MLVIRAGRAFDGERMVSGGVAVIVDGQRIAAVEAASAASTTLPEDWPVEDFPSATVLPGLIDMHVHLCGDGQDGALDRLAGYDLAELGRVIGQALQRQLLAGVTTVRDLGDRRWSVLSWRDRVGQDAAGVPLPTIVASGPPITSVGGHCWSMGGEVSGAAELAAAVEERHQRRVDVVKVMAGGGLMTAGTDALACQFSTDEVRGVTARAHAVGLPVTAHAHGLPAVEQAIQAGVDGIEHCGCLTRSGIVGSDRLLDSLAAAQIAVCPTLGRLPDVTPPPAVLELMARTGATWEARQQLFGRMHSAGVRLVSGTDGGISTGKPHGILAHSISELVAGGVPATAALASATAIAARACGLDQSKGRLRGGYDADLLLVDGDPSTDAAALRRVTAVMSRGRWVDRAA